MNEYYLADEEATLNFGAELAKVTPLGAVIFLEGELGAGKTTFTRGFLRGLGFNDKVKSPTYTLVEPYEISHGMVYHFDLYRLLDPEELIHIGIFEYFNVSSICLIEWPKKGQNWIPEPDMICYLDEKNTGRGLKLEAKSTLGEKILYQINA